MCYITAMGPIRSLELGLSKLIEESNLIVEVEFVERYKEDVVIINKDLKNQAREPIPPFLKKGCVFKTNNILKNSTGIDIPERIKVPEESWRRSFNDHKKKYLNDAVKSYTVHEYITGVKSISKATILFLQHFQGWFELTAKNAFEDNSAHEKIKMLMASHKPAKKR